MCVVVLLPETIMPLRPYPKLGCFSLGIDKIFKYQMVNTSCFVSSTVSVAVTYLLAAVVQCENIPQAVPRQTGMAVLPYNLIYKGWCGEGGCLVYTL